jgi:hypothetical protein
VKGQRKGTGSLDRWRGPEFAGVLELFQREISLRLVDYSGKEQRGWRRTARGLFIGAERSRNKQGLKRIKRGVTAAGSVSGGDFGSEEEDDDLALTCGALCQ